LQVVSNLTTETFLNTFKRFIGRRGKLSDVFSDNGTNFISANHKLEELRKLFNQEEHRYRIVNETSMETSIKSNLFNQSITFYPSAGPSLWESLGGYSHSRGNKIAHDLHLRLKRH